MASTSNFFALAFSALLRLNRSPRQFLARPWVAGQTPAKRRLSSLKFLMQIVSEETP